MHPWNARQPAAFLEWAQGSSQHYALWYVLAMTGMRRGEVLALHWRDVDIEAGTLSVRRSAGIVHMISEGSQMVEDDTKTSKPRVIDLDPDPSAELRAWKSARGSMVREEHELARL